MPYSTACTTPLSNFEAGQNYKDVSDPAVMVTFPLHDDPDGAHLIAWTTTPWTLPSNLALCVNADFDYVKASLLSPAHSGLKDSASTVKSSEYAAHGDYFKSGSGRQTCGYLRLW
eukprot:scaffold30559_cov23-Prasinocladus_malaysianus.AAC.1